MKYPRRSIAHLYSLSCIENAARWYSDTRREIGVFSTVRFAPDEPATCSADVYEPVVRVQRSLGVTSALDADAFDDFCNGCHYFERFMDWVRRMGIVLGEGKGTWSLGQLMILSSFSTALLPQFFNEYTWRSRRRDILRLTGARTHFRWSLGTMPRQSGKTVIFSVVLAGIAFFAPYVKTIGLIAQGQRIASRNLGAIKKNILLVFQILDIALPKNKKPVLRDSQDFFEFEKADDLGHVSIKAWPAVADKCCVPLPSSPARPPARPVFLRSFQSRRYCNHCPPSPAIMPLPRCGSQERGDFFPPVSRSHRRPPHFVNCTTQLVWRQREEWY